MAGVLILTPVLLVGGTERHTQLLARVLCEAGHAVEVWCYHEHEPAMVEAVQAAGARVRLLGLRRKDGLLHLARVLRRLLMEQRPDLVHVEYVAPGFVPVLAARLAGVNRVFATVHQPATPYGRKARLLLRAAARLCTAFFCVSQAAERSWFRDSQAWQPGKKVGSRRHWTLYTGVEVGAIAASATAEGPALQERLGLSGHPVVGVVGRLRHEKGQDVLLGAMSEVIGQVPEARLLVVGDGPDRDGLRAQSKRLGIADKVIWAGAQTPEQVYGTYGAMDVLAVPSRFEGFGLVAVEGMAAGLPVVASDVEGLREILEGMPGGKLVPVGDAGALAKAIVESLQDPKARAGFGAQAQAEVARRFSMGEFAAAHRALCGEE